MSCIQSTSTDCIIVEEKLKKIFCFETTPVSPRIRPVLELQIVNKPLRISPHYWHVDFCRLSPHWCFIVPTKWMHKTLCPGFMILEEDITEGKEDIIID